MAQSESVLINGGRKETNKGQELTEELVASYLRSKPEFIEKYVMEELELETLERWIIRKTQRDKKRAGTAGRKTSLSRWKFCVHADKRQMLQDLTHSLQLRPSMAHVLSELAVCISSAVSADGHRLYLPDTGDQGSLCLYLGNDPENPEWQRIGNTTVANLVARTKEPIRLSRGDSAFPNKMCEQVEHLLLVPVVQPDGQLAAVLEMWRSGPQFHEEDEEIASSYLVWGGIALHYARLYVSMAKQRKLSDFLLAVVNLMRVLMILLWGGVAFRSGYPDLKMANKVETGRIKEFVQKDNIFLLHPKTKAYTSYGLSNVL